MGPLRGAGRGRRALGRLKIERPDELGNDVGRWIAEAYAFLAKPASER